MRYGEIRLHEGPPFLIRTLSVNLFRSMTLDLTVSGTPAQLRWFDRLLHLARRLAVPALCALAALVLLTRDPYRLLDAQLWAEDGPIWIYDAYMRGLPTLLIPHTGYLQTYPRLVGFSSVVFPLAWVPTIFALVGFATQLAPVCLMLSARGRALLPGWKARLPLVAFYIGVPNSFETYVNMTNAQWHVAIIMLLIVLLPAPRRACGRGLEYLFIVIGGLSGPFSFFLAPISWWRVWREGAIRKFRGVQALLLTGTALVQGAIVLSYTGTERHLQPLGASVAGFARILAGQVFMAGIIGAGHVARLEESRFWHHAIVPETIVALCGCVMLVAFVKGGPAYRALVLFAAMILGAALVSPVISNTQPQWDALEVPGAGSRYYLLPILAWFAGLVVLAGDQAAVPRWGARVMIVACLIGMRADWSYGRQPETGFVAAAESFEAAPVATIGTFREAPNPAVWLFTLTKK
jgi:hypothetical protein